MHASKISLATLPALIAFAAFAETAHADPCPPDFTPYIDVQWTTNETGFVPVGGAAVMVAIGGDCNVRSAVPAADLRVSVSRTESGTFRPVAIERRGKLFAWRPSAPGLWFVRVGRTSNGQPPPTEGGAIVLAYEPTAQVRARFQIAHSGPRGGDGVALEPMLDLEVGDRAGAGAPVIWREPFLFLPYSATGRSVVKRLPRGSYGAREGVLESTPADDTPGAPRQVNFHARSEAQRGTVEIASSGAVPLELHWVCKRPMRRHRD